MCRHPPAPVRKVRVHSAENVQRRSLVTLSQHSMSILDSPIKTRSRMPNAPARHTPHSAHFQAQDLSSPRAGVQVKANLRRDAANICALAGFGACHLSYLSRGKRYQPFQQDGKPSPSDHNHHAGFAQIAACATVCSCVKARSPITFNRIKTA